MIIVDDDDRENEGDFMVAARFATPEVINYMAAVGRGLICVPLTESRCDELKLGSMTDRNTSSHETAFTISVDLIGRGCTTGISASDRSKTVLALIDPATTPEELGRPGHIFPLRSKPGGVLRRAGHTEATVDLAVMAGLEPAGVIVEIMKEDGEMARLPDLLKLSQETGIKIISIKDLIAYRLKTESLVTQVFTADLPTEQGNFKILSFTHHDKKHYALTKGEWEKDEPVLVRVHRACFVGDVFGSCACGCNKLLRQSMELIEKEGKGAIVYINREDIPDASFHFHNIHQQPVPGSGISEENDLHISDADMRDYGIGAQIVRSLGISKLKLMTSQPKKKIALAGYNIEIVDVVHLS